MTKFPLFYLFSFSCVTSSTPQLQFLNCSSNRRESIWILFHFFFLSLLWLLLLLLLMHENPFLPVLFKGDFLLGADCTPWQKAGNSVAKLFFGCVHCSADESTWSLKQAGGQMSSLSTVRPQDLGWTVAGCVVDDCRACRITVWMCG